MGTMRKRTEDKEANNVEQAEECNRRANATLFGFDFQVNAAIVLMIENIQEMTQLKLESKNEDIDLTLKDNSHILAQAKAVVEASRDFKNVRNNLKKSLKSLSDGASKVDSKQLIFITNSPNPLKDDESRFAFYGPAHRPFKSLPESSQTIINKFISKLKLDSSFDVNKFMIQIVPFETDIDAEKYKYVKSVIDEFVGSKLLLNSPGLTARMHTVWKDFIFNNGTKSNVKICLSKKELIWPIITVITDISYKADEELEEIIGDVDGEVYDSVIQRYSDIINACCDRFEFVTKVIADYASYDKECPSIRKARIYIKERWSLFESEFKIIADEDTRRALTKVILFSIISNQRNINNIKHAVAL